MSFLSRLLIPLFLLSLGCRPQTSTLHSEDGPLLVSFEATPELDLQTSSDVDVFIRAESAVPLQAILLTFKGRHHENYGEINLWNFGPLFPEQDGRYRLTTSVPLLENDDYSLRSITLVDADDKSFSVDIGPQDTVIPGTELPIPVIRIRGGRQTLGPLFQKVTLDKTEYRRGESIRLSFTMDPGRSKLWLVLVDFAHETKAQTSIVVADVPSNDDPASLSIPIPLDAEPGSYYLSMVSAQDEENQFSSLRALSDSPYFFNSWIPVPRLIIQ